MIATLIMGSRYRPLLVWLGATLAFAIHAAVAVAVGQLLQLLPHRWIEGVTAVLFAAGAAYLLFVPEKEEEDEGEEEADSARQGSKTVGAAFLVIFVGEFGDLTQILTANLAAKYHAPAAVFIGAFAALATRGRRRVPSAAGPCSGSCPWPSSARREGSCWPGSPSTPWSP